MVEDVDETDDESPVGDALLHYNSKTKDKPDTIKKPMPSRHSKPIIHINTDDQAGFQRNLPDRKPATGHEPVHLITSKPVPPAEKLSHPAPSNIVAAREIKPAIKVQERTNEIANLDDYFAHFEKRLKTSLVGQIETVVKNVLSGSVRDALLKEFVDKLQASVVQEVKRSFQAYFTTQVQDALKATIKKELEKELGQELRGEFSREIIQAREITSKLSNAYKDFTKDVTVKVTSALEQEVRDEFNRELRKAREVSDIIKGSVEPLKRVIKEELRSDITQDIQRQLPGLFRKEIKDELIREIKDEIGTSVNNTIVQDISDAIKQDVNEFVASIAKQRSRMALLNVGSDIPLHLVFIDFNNLWAVANKYTTTYPNIRHLLILLRELLRKYDDQFTPDHVSGFIYCSRYHEAEVNRVFDFKFEEDPDLEAMVRQFQCEIESEKKMLDNGQVKKIRDVDVLLATQASAMIAKNAQRIATVTLVSGDGDLNPVLDFAKQYGIHTICFSFKHGTSSSLKFNADELQFLDNFPEILGKKA